MNILHFRLGSVSVHFGNPIPVLVNESDMPSLQPTTNKLYPNIYTNFAYFNHYHYHCPIPTKEYHFFPLCPIQNQFAQLISRDARMEWMNLQWFVPMIAIYKSIMNNSNTISFARKQIDLRHRLLTQQPL